ncbi:hypothetical protein SNEBB_003518 [Seison nebaliae]|nr:hypothetical protein SNEBB_003518 [Seison nebaliae]
MEANAILKYMDPRTKWTFIDNVAYPPNKVFKACGFYNSPDLGLCMTNAILAMLISSRKFVDLIQRLHPVNKKKYKECILQIQADPKNRKFRTNDQISDAKVLSEGLTSTHLEDSYYDRELGVAGHYYLAKEYRKIPKNSCKKNVDPSAGGCTIDKKCCITTILNAKNTLQAYARFGEVLTSLFGAPRELIMGELIGLQWFRAGGYLNTHFNVKRNPHFYEFLPYPNDPIKDLPQKDRSKALKWIKKEKVRPKFLSLSYQVWATENQIHPSLVHLIVHSYTNPTGRPLFADLVIPYVYKGMSLPDDIGLNRLGQTHDVGFEFLNGEDRYKLKGFNVFLTRPRVLPYASIPKRHQKNTTSTDCTRYLIDFTMNFIVENRIYEHLPVGRPQILKDLQGLFFDVCYHFEHNLKVAEKVRQPCHEFSIIQRDNSEWWIMNDDKSTKMEIKDILTFIELENVNSFFFEKTDSTTTTTVG